MYAELNREQFGKNNRQLVQVYSGEHHFEELSSTVEVPGPWYFPPVASLVTAGGRLLLAILERLVRNAGGTYMMCDTDSLAIVSTKRGGLVPCVGGPHRLADGSEAIKALSWRQVEEIASKFARLNPYNPTLVREILKVEDYNFDREGKRHQLYGLAFSAKRYLLFRGNGEIIKPSEHGLGPYFHPDRQRYVPQNCKNQKDSYPQWMVDAWRWILRLHQKQEQRAPSWFRILAMRKIAITTPHVLSALRRIDRQSAKPYNFVISPIQTFEGPTLVTSFSDDPSRWSGLLDGPDYISVESGKKFRLARGPEEDELIESTPEFVRQNNTKPIGSTFLRYLDTVIRGYAQHPESKSLAPDGSPCTAETRGLLRRRPIQAVTPFRYIGKEVDRRTQDDSNVFSSDKPLEYGPRRQPAATLAARRRHANKALENQIGNLSIKELARRTGLDRNTVRRWRRGERVHLRTSLMLLKAVSSTALGSGTGPTSVNLASRPSRTWSGRNPGRRRSIFVF